MSTNLIIDNQNILTNINIEEDTNFNRYDNSIINTKFVHNNINRIHNSVRRSMFSSDINGFGMIDNDKFNIPNDGTLIWNTKQKNSGIKYP